MNFRKYISGTDAEIIKRYMQENGIKRKSDAMAILREEIPKEQYYQKKIMEGIKKEYPNAFMVKIAQGAYSQCGLPDILIIHKGHYFGFEVKRPCVGVYSNLQKFTIQRIREAGGTADFVRWPEEAIEMIKKWEESK